MAGGGLLCDLSIKSHDSHELIQEKFNHELIQQTNINYDWFNFRYIALQSLYTRMESMDRLICICA